VSSDLSADLTAELSAAAAPAAAAPAATAAARRLPAVAVVFTPLHWASPSVAAPATGRGVVLSGGPWQVDVQL
jgi:hypothetical protein